MCQANYTSAVAVDGTRVRHYISTDPVGVEFAWQNTSGSHRRHLSEPNST